MPYPIWVRKKAKTMNALTRSMLMRRNQITITPIIVIIRAMHAMSMSQAKNRLTGPASTKEKVMPSGV
jgi:hypothetical protein